MWHLLRCASPLGSVLLAADETGLTGAWFEEAQALSQICSTEYCWGETPVLKEGRCALACYFSGKEPFRLPPLHPEGTVFQRAVWNCLLEIPYGQTTTYGAVARRLAAERGTGKVAAQAVGGAVGRNKIAIFIPCHRVIGADGSLTGYAGGIERKAALLRLERHDLDLFEKFSPNSALRNTIETIKPGEVPK